MVRVINVAVRKNEKGEYVSLQLQGDIVMVQSQNTGRFYATAKKCWVYSTFSEGAAKSLIDSTIPGSIVRVACDPYDYTIEETGEVVRLAHTYGYVPHEGATPTYIPTQQQQGVGVE